MQTPSLTLARIVACCLFLAALSGCGGGGGNAAPSPRQYGPLLVMLTPDKAVYGRSEPVTSTFTFVNTSSAPVAIQFGSCRYLASQVQNVGYFDWWPSTDPGGCPGIVQTRIMAPGEASSYRVNWDQKAPDGTLVSPGSYILIVRLNAYTVDGVEVINPASYISAAPVSVTILNR